MAIKQFTFNKSIPSANFIHFMSKGKFKKQAFAQFSLSNWYNTSLFRNRSLDEQRGFILGPNSESLTDSIVLKEGRREGQKGLIY